LGCYVFEPAGRHQSEAQKRDERSDNPTYHGHFPPSPTSRRANRRDRPNESQRATRRSGLPWRQAPRRVARRLSGRGEGPPPRNRVRRKRARDEVR
jgi:hypothetical protein